MRDMLLIARATNILYRQKRFENKDYKVLDAEQLFA
jgi:hypothetical protein